MAHLSLETSLVGRVAVIALGGELDLAGATLFEDAVARVDEAAPAALVVDLRGLEFMDSSGLRVIALAARRAQEHGRRFALVPGKAQVMRVFEITRMGERLTFVDDPAEVNEPS